MENRIYIPGTRYYLREIEYYNDASNPKMVFIKNCSTALNKAVGKTNSSQVLAVSYTIPTVSVKGRTSINTYEFSSGATDIKFSLFKDGFALGVDKPTLWCLVEGTEFLQELPDYTDEEIIVLYSYLSTCYSSKNYGINKLPVLEGIVKGLRVKWIEDFFYEYFHPELNIASGLFPKCEEINQIVKDHVFYKSLDWRNNTIWLQPDDRKDIYTVFELIHDLVSDHAGIIPDNDDLYGGEDRIRNSIPDNVIWDKDEWCFLAKVDTLNYKLASNHLNLMYMANVQVKLPENTLKISTEYNCMTYRLLTILRGSRLCIPTLAVKVSDKLAIKLNSIPNLVIFNINTNRELLLDLTKIPTITERFFEDNRKSNSEIADLIMQVNVSTWIRDWMSSRNFFKDTTSIKKDDSDLERYNFLKEHGIVNSVYSVPPKIKSKLPNLNEKYIPPTIKLQARCKYFERPYVGKFWELLKLSSSEREKLTRVDSELLQTVTLLENINCLRNIDDSRESLGILSKRLRSVYFTLFASKSLDQLQSSTVQVTDFHGMPKPSSLLNTNSDRLDMDFQIYVDTKKRK